MAPEMEVTSTVASGNSNNSSDSDQSNEMPMTTMSAVSLNSSNANLQSNIENQYKVRESAMALRFYLLHLFDCYCLFVCFIRIT